MPPRWRTSCWPSRWSGHKDWKRSITAGVFHPVPMLAKPNVFMLLAWRHQSYGESPGAGARHALFIEPGSPWENGCNESFNGTLRYDLLDVELFDTLLEAKVLIERWRVQYNTIRPHSSLATVRRPQRQSNYGPNRQDGACRKRISSRKMLC